MALYLFGISEVLRAIHILCYDLLKGQTLNSGLQFHTQKLLNILPLRKSHLRCFSAENYFFLSKWEQIRQAFAQQEELTKDI